MAALFGRIEHVCFMGQTGIPGVFTEDGRFLTPDQCEPGFSIPNEKTMINVGAVGWPRRGDPRACYVVFQKNTISFRRVEYDSDRAATRMREYPALTPFANSWYRYR